jgi:TonB-dependent receptor
MALAPVGLVKAQSHGIVSGSVTDVSSDLPLPGANIIVVGTSIGTTSELSGNYVLARVPSGTVTIQASYIGYTTVTREIQVTGGQTMMLDFTMDAAGVTGDEAVVLGVRAAGQAKALSQQKNAPNIKNIIASDQIGQFPDATAPDALQRVPGISVERDQGEGRFIQIRGGPPQYSTIMFNGERIPSPEGDVRQIALDAIPAEILGSIEVSKAITPDMDADAIGGAIDLQSIRPATGSNLAVEAGGGFAPIRDGGAFRGSAVFSGRTADEKLGYIVNGSFSQRNFGSDDIEPVWDFGDDDKPLGGDDALEELEVRYYDLLRQRIGGNAELNYATGSTSLYVRGLLASFKDTEQRLRLTHVIEDDELSHTHKNRTEYLDTYSFQAGGSTVLQNGIQIDYRGAYTTSQEDTPYDDEIEWIQGDVSFDPDISDPIMPMPNPQNDALNNPSAFEFDVIEPATSITTNDDIVGALDLKVPYQLGNSSGFLKFGGKVRSKQKDQDITEMAYELTDEADDILLGQGNGESYAERYDVSSFGPGPYPLSSIITGDDEVLEFGDKYSGSLEVDEDAELEGNLEDFEAEELTIGGYVMTELNITPKLNTLLGVRYERTNLKSAGYKSIVEEEIDDGDLSTSLEDIERVEAENDYGYFFPMVHLRYAATPSTNLRAAFTTALARPNFFDLAPYQIRDDDEIELGNPELDPSRSKNFDLMAEHYLSGIGIISAGGFYKLIDDPIIPTITGEEIELDGETFEVDVFQPVNGESGYIAGVEVAYQQQFRFLRGALSGLGLYANYTYTDSEVELQDGSKNRFPGQAKHVANGALNYENSGFFIQVALNYSGEYVSEFAGDGVEADRDNDLYTADRWGLDANFRVTFSNGISIFGEFLNLLNSPLKVYQGDPDRPIQREYYRQWGWLGVRYTL